MAGAFHGTARTQSRVAKADTTYAYADAASGEGGRDSRRLRADLANTLISGGGAFRGKSRSVAVGKGARELKGGLSSRADAHAHGRGSSVRVYAIRIRRGNQLPLEKKQLKAVGADGTPCGSLAWVLGLDRCPARRSRSASWLSMSGDAFELHRRDGLFTSEDYAICQCRGVGAEVFDMSSRLARDFRDVAQRRRNATVWCSARFLRSEAALFVLEPPVPRRRRPSNGWTRFFTPHSAAIEPSLIAKERGAWWTSEARGLRQRGPRRLATRE